MNDLFTRYHQHIIPELQKELNLSNRLAVPQVKKVVVNVGVPKSDHSSQHLELISQELAAITGQKPKITTAKRSIAGFKIRAGDPVGLTVTLRGRRMFDFLDKLCRIVLPRVKDFRGLRRDAFDSHGNYTIGLTEQIIFPEIDYSKVDHVHGLEITIVTSALNDKQAYLLLQKIGIPFAKE